jgi:hypothetical protein
LAYVADERDVLEHKATRLQSQLQLQEAQRGEESAQRKERDQKVLQLKVEVEKARERESALARERAELHDVLIMAREQQHAAPGPRLSTSGDTEKLEKQLQEEKLKTQGINKLSEMMMRKVLMEELSKKYKF